MPKFVDEYLAGKIKAEAIDDYIDWWHEEDRSGLPLSQFLGFTSFEYSMWVAKPDDLDYILSRRNTYW